MGTEVSVLPRIVVFDIGNVVLRWDPEAILREQAPLDRDPGLLMREIFQHADWVDLDRGTLEEEEANQRFAARTGRPIELIRRLHLAAKTSLVPIPESVDLLEELHGKGITLYCLSNMARGTFDFLIQRYRFWENFDGMVISAHVGLVKPDPAIFQRLLSTYSIRPEDAVFIDDNRVNVESAEAVGLRGHVFTGARSARLALAGQNHS